jgi:hypothetical protein
LKNNNIITTTIIYKQTVFSRAILRAREPDFLPALSAARPTETLNHIFAAGPTRRARARGV